jgi:spore coat protein CotH
MTLNNLYDDASFLAERLAYDVYRAAGVPAPRCNSTRVYINGEFYGVYTNIEAEDKHFLQRWFASNDGNLYEKDGFSDLSIDAESDFQLETNETLGDRSDLLALFGAVDAATNPETFLGDLATVLDTEAFLKFTAVEAAVNQWDMHAFTVYYVHNFRLYSDPDSGLFSWIPWGHDLSMKPFRVDVKDYVPLFELATQGAEAGQVTAGVIFQRCIQSAACKAALVEAVEETIVVWEGLDMEATAARYYDQIRPLVMQDTRKRTFNGDLSMEEFDAAYTVLQRTLSGRIAALRADLANQ